MPRRSKFVKKAKAVKSFKSRQKEFVDEREVDIKNARKRRKKLRAAQVENKEELKRAKRRRKGAKEKGPWESEAKQRLERAKKKRKK